MKAFIVDAWCEPHEMEFREIPDPSPGPDELLIEIKAAGVNFPDKLLIAGKYQWKPRRPFTPGAELAGVVLAAGANVDTFKAGDRVMSVSWIGGYAQKAAVQANDCYKMPDAMSFEEAAGFLVTYQSSYFGVITRGALQPGEKLLVHAGAGGIGTAAIQIGKAAGAGVIMATAGSEEKLEIARQAGADVVFNYKEKGWSRSIRKEYGGANVVIDPVGGDAFDKSILCTAFEGRIVVVGFTSGTIPRLSVNYLLINNISAVGLFWNLYFKEHKDLAQMAMDQLFAWYNAGKIKPIIFDSFPLSDAPDALEKVCARKTYGKVVLRP